MQARIQIPFSSKLDSFIQIGNHRHRIADDHKALLIELHLRYRYLRMEQLLMLTSYIGASLAVMFDLMMLINVRFSAAATTGGR